MKDQSHDRQSPDRRSFVKASLAPAVLAIPDSPDMRQAQGSESPPDELAAGPQWPFRTTTRVPVSAPPSLFPRPVSAPDIPNHRNSQHTTAEVDGRPSPE